MQIKLIGVQKLFGLFNHSVELNNTDKITIIHGPNGVGKTVFLRLIHSLFESKFAIFDSVPFELFYLEFTNGDKVEIRRSLKNLNSNGAVLSYFYSSKDKKRRKHTVNLSKIDSYDDRAQRRHYFETKYGGHVNHMIPVEDAIQWNYRYYFGESTEKEPVWLRKLTSSIQSHFIEAQRLHLSQKKGEAGAAEFKQVVMAYSEELSKILKTKLAESAEVSQALDRTFPKRLLESSNAASYSEAGLRTKLAELEERRNELKLVGLLDKDEDRDFQVPQKIDKDKLNVLTIYIGDVEQKLEVFKETSEKLSILRRIINKRFLYKKIHISKEKGIYFLSDGGDSIDVKDLSSGEQHELILFFFLLFKVEPNSLILIDEPELSLHIAWQLEFLRDIQEIIDVSKASVLIATHSPEIINNRWDLTVQLQGPKKIDENSSES